MSKEVGAGHVAIYPVFKGLRKSIKNEVDSGVSDAERSATKNLGKAGQKGGAALGKGLKSAMATEASDLGGKALKAFEQDVATTSRALSAARLRQQNDAGAVRVAEQRLTEALQKHGEGSSQAIAAEERLASVRRNLEASTSRVATASTDLQAAQAKLTAVQDELAASTARLEKAGAGSAFTTFRKNLSDLFAPVTTLSRGLTGLARAALEPVTRRLTSFGLTVGTAVIGRLQAAAAPLRAFGTLVGSQVTSALSAAGAAVTGALAPALTRLQPLTSAIGRSFQGAAGLARQALSGLTGVASTVGAGISGAFSTAMAGVKRVTSDAATFVQSQMAAAAVVVVGALSAAVVGGFNRLSAIETAQAKLRGLGNTAEDVTTITQNALDAVRGTAYGLDEAATIAASAVAAGIKPGQELEKYLKLTADAASIANVPLSEMGSILNKVTTNGRAYTTELNQLADRGIPIYQWLASELGVTQDALRDMVAAGEVDAATYRKVIEQNIGGAALEAGKTTQGALKNMRAAFSRFGATVLGPIFPLFQQLFSTITVGVDALAARVAPVMQFIGDGIVARVQPALQSLADTFTRLKDGAGGIDLSGLSGGFAALLPVIGGVVGLFGSLLSRLPFMSALFGGLTGPVGLLAGALAALFVVDPSTLASGFASLVPAITSGITSLLTTVVGLVSTVVPQIASQLVANAPILLDGMVQLLLGLVQAVTTVLPQLIQAVIGIIPSLITTLLGLVPTLLQAGLQLFMGLVQAVVIIVPQLITAVLTLLPQLLTTILSMLPTIIQAGLQVFLGLVLALTEMIPQLLTTLVGMLPQILTTLIGMIPQLIITALDVFLALVTGLLDAIPQLLVAIIGMLPQIVTTLIGLVPTLITAAVQLFTSLIDALPVIIPRLIDALIRMGPQIVNAIMQIIPALFNAGKAIIQGLIDGIFSMFGAVGDAVGGLMDWVGGFFPHSPAKRGPFSGSGWTRVASGGQALAEQFADGVRAGSRAASIEAAFGAMSAELTTATAPGTTGAGGTGSSGTGESRGDFMFISRTTDPRAAAREAYELFRRESGGLDDGGSEDD